MLVLRTHTFHGHLIDLLGKGRGEIVARHPLPTAVVEGNGAERLSWREEAVDEDGRPMFVDFMARIYSGQVWAVGLHADRYHFVLENTTEGTPFLAAVRKEPRHDSETVNWIVLREGRAANAGASR